MLNLPGFTFAMIVGIPALWVVYTLVFLWLSRNWERDEDREAQR